jgi:hypothetical protein
MTKNYASIMKKHNVLSRFIGLNLLNLSCATGTLAVRNGGISILNVRTYSQILQILRQVPGAPLRTALVVNSRH